MKIYIVFIIISTLTLKCWNAEAVVKLPAIISDNMVLQGGMNTPVWGWARPGEEVEIKFDNKLYKTLADCNGNWNIKLKALKDGGPYKLEVAGESNLITVSNILVGEVWLASGQSNMEFGIQTEDDGKNEIQEFEDNQIRFFWVPFAKSFTERQDIDAVKEGSLNGRWVVCNPNTMAENWAWHGFSAVGYYYAKAIRKSSGKAVGLIGSYKGGTEAQTWISQSGYDIEPALPDYKEKHCQLEKDSKVKNVEADFKGPSNAYNAMISPICPYGIRGVIWYQGESNGDNMEEAKEYTDIFPRLIQNWRNLWDEGDFPFLFVQLPNFRKEAVTPSEGNWPWVREAQLKALSLKNTGMAVTIDLGDPDNIHPTSKKEVGVRLALIADYMLYEKNTEFQGPIFKSQKIKGNQIILSFKSNTRIKKGQIDGFGIAAQDGNFVWANAISDGKKIIVSCKDVDNPVAVRYNWGDNPTGNLYGENNLPASPFRTDSFEKN